MKKILVGHPFWGRGGAEIAAMWMLQALLEDYRVDIVTRGGWDLDELNRAAGTNIPEGVVQIRYAPFSGMRIAGALGLGYYKRYCRKIAPQYDLCITASRVIDWGVPAIHFLTDVTWNKELQREFASAEEMARKGVLRSYYWWLSDLIAGRSGRVPEQNDLFVANSQWTAKFAKEYYVESVQVIYPAVSWSCSDLTPWDSRENAFVFLGRISIEKNIEQVFLILDLVRETVPSIILNLIGNFDAGTYGHKISALCEARKEWIVIHDGLYGVQKETLLGKCRYGISACEREAFGIATAEMLKAGVIPFVPKEGAQREMLNDERLCYETTEDAGAKIREVIDSISVQKELHAQMLKTGLRYSSEKFCEEVKALIQAVIR